MQPGADASASPSTASAAGDSTTPTRRDHNNDDDDGNDHATTTTCTTSSTTNQQQHAVVLPSSCSSPLLHPLHVLDMYLDSLSTRTKTSAAEEEGCRRDEDSGGSDRNNDAVVVDEILTLASTLFGNTLDGALAILEASTSLSHKQQQQCPTAIGEEQNYHNRHHHGLQPRHSMITKVVAVTSGRSMFLVKGSSSSAYNSSRRNSSNDSNTGDCYLCILPDNRQDGNCRSSSGELTSPGICAAGNNNDGFYYCSCRSFLERCGRLYGVGTNAAGVVVICKHLLALKLLMTPLGAAICKECCIVETAISDDEFARLIVSRISV